MRDATARAQAWIGDRAPAEFRRNVEELDTYAIQPGSVYRTCVPSPDRQPKLLRDRQDLSPVRAQRDASPATSRTRCSPRAWDSHPVSTGSATTKRIALVRRILGSGIVFLDGTIVNVALPAIRAGLHGALADQQWVVEAYLLTLSSLLLVGGSLGDLFGRRRVFSIGLVGFGACSLPVRSRRASGS